MIENYNTKCPVCRQVFSFQNNHPNRQGRGLFGGLFRNIFFSIRVERGRRIPNPIPDQSIARGKFILFMNLNSLFSVQEVFPHLGRDEIIRELQRAGSINRAILNLSERLS